MIDTPYLCVDVALLEENLRATADLARRHGLQLRPHAKTHKCAEIAKRQITLGATGLTVATIGEAEAFADQADERCADLFIAYPLWVTPGKGARLRALARHTTLRVGVDSVSSARRLADELGDSEATVVVEVDSGQHRTGVPPDEAGVVAAAAVELGLCVTGIFTFPGHGYGPGDARRLAAAQEVTALSEAADRLREVGIDPVVRSGGSTPTAGFARSGVLTEIRPGVYPFNDAQQVALGSCDPEHVALTAVSTVVHRRGTRVVADAGSKILGADRPDWLSGYGHVLGDPGAVITSLSEHHAVIEFGTDSPSSVVPDLGDTIRLVPNHVCSAVNLVDELLAVDPSGPSWWPVIARGANS